MTQTETRSRNRFTSEQARAAGKKSAEVRRERKRLATTRKRRLAELPAQAAADNLGEVARLAAADIVHRVALGEVGLGNAKDAATMLRELYAIARTEAGQPTSFTLTASLSGESIAEAAHALRQKVLATRGQGELARAERVDAMPPSATQQVSASHDADAVQGPVPPSPPALEV